MRTEISLALLLLWSPACSDDNAAGNESEAVPTSRPSAVATKRPSTSPEMQPVAELAQTTRPEVDTAPTPVVADIEIDIRNARYIDSTVLLGGQPSETQFSAAADLGYQLIVTLRGAGESGTSGEQALVEELGMRYLQIPMANGGGLTEDNARALAAVLDDPDNRPLMVHCGSGNRVGGLFALKAFFVDGASTEAALEIGRKAGMRASLEPRVKAAMK